MSITLHDRRSSASDQSTGRDAGQTKPPAFQANASFSDAVPMTDSFVFEVRVFLTVNKTSAWWLPIHFCVGELLAADELITKIDDAFRILHSWSSAKTLDESIWASLPFS